MNISISCTFFGNYFSRLHRKPSFQRVVVARGWLACEGRRNSHCIEPMAPLAAVNPVKSGQPGMI